MKKLIFFLLFLFITLSLSIPGIKAQSTDPIIIQVNNIRKSYKLASLTESRQLDISATQKACDLRDKDYWAHKDPDGKMSWYMFVKAGYYYRFAGENLAKNCTDLRCVELWMRSPTHRAIILANYKDIGVGRCGIFKVIHLGVKN